MHGTVAGNPEAESAGATVNLHVVAVPPTTADSETLPPDEGRADGDAAKPDTVGAADAWLATAKNTDTASARHSPRETFGRKDIPSPYRS